LGHKKEETRKKDHLGSKKNGRGQKKVAVRETKKLGVNTENSVAVRGCGKTWEGKISPGLRRKDEF